MNWVPTKWWQHIVKMCTTSSASSFPPLILRVANFIIANYGTVSLGGESHWNAFGLESIR